MQKWTFMDVKLYDNATTCKEGTFFDLVCVVELVTDDNDGNDDRQFMTAQALWHSANEPKKTEIQLQKTTNIANNQMKKVRLQVVGCDLDACLGNN